MDAKVGGGLAGCGCGLVVATGTFFVVTPLVTFLGWALDESGMAHIDPEEAIPVAALLGTVSAPVCGLLSAVLAAFLAYRMLARSS